MFLVGWGCTLGLESHTLACHSQVRLGFNLAAGLDDPWCRDGGIPQGCRLGWYEVIRGPHPPVRPVEFAAEGAGQGQGQDSRGASSVSCARDRWRQGVPQHDEVRVGASNKITRSQLVLAILGEDDALERSALEAALKKAQVQVVILIPPVPEQIEQHRSSSNVRRNGWWSRRSTFSGYKNGRSSARRSCRRQKNVC